MATSQDYSRSILGGSDEVPVIFCEPCENEGKQIEAGGYCEDCPEYLCAKCYRDHRRHRAFRNHVLIDKANMPLDESTARYKDVCFETCKRHHDKTVKYFCGSCDALCCTVCININHRGCQNMEHIPDIAKDLQTRDDLKQFTEQLDRMSILLDNNKQSILSNVKSNNKMIQQAMEDLKRQRNEINKFFDNLDMEMDKRVKIIQSENSNNLKAASKRCDSIRNDLKQIKSDTDLRKKNGQKCELFIAMKNAKTTLNKLDEECNILKQENMIQKCKLIPSLQIQEMMASIKQICVLKTAKLESEIAVHSKHTKKGHRITGLAMIHGQYCVVADYWNKSLKMIDTKTKRVVSDMIAGDEVWGVTAMMEDMIAVSVSGDSKRGIQFLSVSMSGSVNNHNMIKTAMSCFDIVQANDKHYLRHKALKFKFLTCMVKF